MISQKVSAITNKTNLGYALHKFIKDKNNKPYDYIFIDVNTAYEKHFGFKANTILGKSVKEVFPDIINDKHNLIEVYSNVAYCGESIEIEQFFNSLNKGYKIYAFQYAKGYFITLFEDITEKKNKECQELVIKKKAEQELEIFKIISDNALYGKAIADINGTITYVNNFFANIHGYQPKELIGKHISIFHNKKQLVKVNKILNHLLETGSFDMQEVWHKHKNGKEFPMSMSGIVIKDSKECPMYIATSAVDITKSKENEERVKKLKYEFETVFEGTQDGMYLLEAIDIDTYLFVQVNNSGSELVGIPSEDIIGKSPVEVFGDLMGNNMLERFRDCYRRRQSIHYDEKREFISGNKHVNVRLTPIIEDERVKYIVGASRDVTIEKEYLQRVEYLSYHDQLTGLYNRRFYEMDLKRLSKQQYLPLSFIIADLNGLKLINDSFGHKKGDELLIKTGKILANNTPKKNVVARIGGDEFIIILPNTNYEKAKIIKDNLEKACQEEDVSPVVLSVSFGVATLENMMIDIEKKIQEAEENMYHNKLQKRPSVRGETLKAILSALHEKNPFEEKHNSRVSDLSEKLAIALGLDSKSVSELKLTGLLHDIGKIAIDLSILDKKEELNEQDWAMIKKHPEIGYRILNEISHMTDIAKYVLMHHERLDGKGYPQGLKGSEIPLQARVIAVADFYDALTSYRPYRDKMTKAEAIKELKKCCGSQFDPNIVNVFISKVLRQNEDS